MKYLKYFLLIIFLWTAIVLIGYAVGPEPTLTPAPTPTCESGLDIIYGDECYPWPDSEPPFMCVDDGGCYLETISWCIGNCVEDTVPLIYALCLEVYDPELEIDYCSCEYIVGGEKTIMICP